MSGYHYFYEVENTWIHVTLTKAEKLSICDIESLAQICHQERRSWSNFWIRYLGQAFSVRMDLRVVTELDQNDFNGRLIAEGWSVVQFDLATEGKHTYLSCRAIVSIIYLCLSLFILPTLF